MAKISLVIAIVVTLLTAGLAFVTKTKVDGVQSALKSERTVAEHAKAEAEKKTKEAKKAAEELTAANKALDEQKAQVATLEGDVKSAKDEVEKSKTAATDLQKQIDDLKKEIADASGAKPDPNAPKPDAVKEIEQQKANLEKELAEAKQVQESLKLRQREAETKLADSVRTIEQYRQPGKMNSISGKVTAVNPGWNFVVLNIGDRQGASVNTPLLVMRDGQMIARLKISSVEPGSAVADVISGSLGRGESIQPGDSVVFAGRRSEPSAAVPPAPAPAAAPR